jgi:hypothetical protein
MLMYADVLTYADVCCRCVHSALTGLAAPFDGVNNRQRDAEDEAEDSVMSVMEELASENADVSRIRVGQGAH